MPNVWFDVVENSDKEIDDENLFWSNFDVADKHHDLTYVCILATQWMNQAETGTDWSEFENELRKRDMHTHLFAQPFSPPPDLGESAHIRLPDGLAIEEGKEPLQVTFSCRPPPFAQQEVLENAKSVEDNLASLKEAGTITVDPETSEDTEIKPVMALHSELLKKGSHRLVATQFDDLTTQVSHVRRSLYKLYGRDATTVITNLPPEVPEPYFVFVIDGEVVLPFAFPLSALDNNYKPKPHRKLHNPHGVYPLLEDEINPMNAILASGHGDIQSDPMKYSTGSTPTRIHAFDDIGDSVCSRARQRFNTESDYHSSSYPTRNLTKHALDAWEHAVTNKQDHVMLPNFCCTMHNCPQIHFMQKVVDCLIEQETL